VFICGVDDFFAEISTSTKLDTKLEKGQKVDM